MQDTLQAIYDVLKTQSNEDVLCFIDDFMAEIDELKHKIEGLFSIDEADVQKAKQQIENNRQYIAVAEKILCERGVEYNPNDRALRALEFNERLASVTQIKLLRGGAFSGFRNYTVTIGDEMQRVAFRHNMDREPPREWSIGCSKSEFIAGLSALYMGEWKQNYRSPIIDGVQWQIIFEYADGTEYKIKGSNAYPYNFDELYALCGIKK